MSFIDDIKICMLGDSTLNALATGGIYYDSTPIGADKAKNWIVYDYNRTGSEDTVSIKDVVVYYDLEIQIISNNVAKIKEISDRLYNYLSTYSDTRIRDISLSEENKVEQNEDILLFYKTDVYTIMYDRC